MKTALLALLCVGMAVFLLFHQVQIMVFGQVVIYEPSPVVLILESAFMVGVIGFGLFCLWKEFSNCGGQRR